MKCGPEVNQIILLFSSIFRLRQKRQKKEMQFFITINKTTGIHKRYKQQRKIARKTVDQSIGTERQLALNLNHDVNCRTNNRKKPKFLEYFSCLLQTSK